MQNQESTVKIRTDGGTYLPLPSAWSSLVEGDDGFIGPSGKLLCV